MTQPATVLRQHCLALFRSGVAAADPGAAVRRHLQYIGGHLQIVTNPTNQHSQSGDWSKIHIIAFGKAACAMADAARQAIPRHLLAEPGIAVTTYENARPVDGFEVLGAGHPLPDANGLNAARKIAAKVQQAGRNELVLALISGGGSALLPYPVTGVSLADKAATTELLLACGANINQINCVRKHLSQIKGGGLARLAPPAALHALILSDVLGDDLSAIASGPTVADDTTFADAIAVFKSKHIWDQVPSTVKTYLEQGAKGLKPETAKPSDAAFGMVSHTLVGSNAISVSAVIEAAQHLGYHTELYSSKLCGEAREIAAQLATDCKKLMTNGLNQATALIAGGETTVSVTGTGKGGRNQEIALAFALSAEKLGLNAQWTFLSAGTDGHDGPTDAAGGIVDNQTLSKIRGAGIDPQAALANNDAYTALQAANDLVTTGATGTNVADLQILLLQPTQE